MDDHMATAIRKGKSQVGKMDAILIDPHLDTGITICILMDVIVPELEYAEEVWERNVKLVQSTENSAGDST